MNMARRTYGDGSIYQRKDKRWVAYLRLPDGRKRFVYGDTRRDVSKRLSEAALAQRQGLLPTGPNQTLAQYLERWLEDRVKPSVRPNTYYSYDLNVRRLLPYIGRLKVADISPEAVQNAYGALLRKGLSARSVEQAHTVLHRALRQAVLWGLAMRNPTDAVTVPRGARREMRTLTEDQVRHLFEATEDDRLHALWVLLATTGLRLGEALGLKWTDIDLDARTAVVQRSVQRERRVGFMFVEPKTGRSRRSVPMATGTVNALLAHHTRQTKERLAAGELWNDLGLVFSNPTGGHLWATSLNSVFHNRLRAAGLPDLRIHDLRHTAASHLLTRGVHPKVVQELLGHSTITLTLDTYSHVVPSLTRDAADQMEGFFRASNS
jgi:integrase